MKKYILTCCFLLISLYSQSQQKWTLRQCIDYAIENNIEIKQQELKVKSSEIDLSTSKNSRLPDLNASVGYGFSFGQTTNRETNNFESANSSGGSFNVATSLPLFTGFRISNEIKRDEFNLMASIEGLNKAKENLELQVTSYYLDVLFKKEILKAYSDQAEMSRSQVEKTEILVEAGKVPLSQLYDIKAQLANDELNVTMATNNLSLSLLNLSQSLNITDSYEGFDIVDPFIEDVVGDNISSLLPPDQIYKMAIAIKPHVKEAQYNIESSKNTLKAAKSGYFPTLDFNMNYGTQFQRIYNQSNLSFSDQWKNLGSEYIGFSLTIPIFNRFQVRNRVRSARVNIQNNELILDNVKLALYKEIQQAYQSAVAAQSKYTSTEKAYEAATEAYTYAQERYDIGKSTVFEYIEAQTKLLTSRSEQIQAKYDFLFRAKILDFYRGEEIDIR